MARARNIKPGFFTNDNLGELSAYARLAFIGLWSQADFNGNMKYKPKRLKVEVLPYDNVDFSELVKELSDAGFVMTYETGGDQYLHVINFKKHQRPHKNEVLRGTDVPQPEEETAQNSPELEQERNGTEPGRDENRSNPPDTGYLIPDTGYRIPDSEKNKGPSADEPAPVKSPPPKKFAEAEFDEFWETCRSNWHGVAGTKAEAKKEFLKLDRSSESLDEITRLTLVECQSRKRQHAAEGFAENMKHVCRWIKYRGWEGVADRPRGISSKIAEMRKNIGVCI
jgi:uncharacterized protein YlbG (UPF0298 family)